MLPSWRAVRARLLTPNRAEARLDVRGFRIKDEASRQRLERVGGCFLDGFRHALEATGPETVASRLGRVDRQDRGFAYEGAAAVTDEARMQLPTDGELPAYEAWRQRIQSQFRLARR